jgi:ectoine hydroxylase-related dioxygenase (phytanoyl-CoA dioxygenase family)
MSNINFKEQNTLFNECGYAFGPTVLKSEEILKANSAIDEILENHQEFPHSMKNKGRDFNPDRDLLKFDQAHVTFPAIYEAITSPLLGEAIADILEVNKVQIWAAQLLNKPGGSSSTASVGWHQDYQYWQPFWTPDSQLLTAWLAFTDVQQNSGPMNFIDKSHTCGFKNEGSFFETIGDVNKGSINLPDDFEWNEIAATMEAGAFSLHHDFTFHGSYPNTSGLARRSIAIHICTENSTATPRNTKGYDYTQYLDDPAVSPVIFER